MGQVILLSLTASLNPTLVAATTVMLLLDKPARLMLGYLLGAYVTSITLGLVIVFSASNSSTTNTTENTLSPAVDIALGLLALVGAWAVWSGRHERFRERRQARKAAKPDKGPPRWQRELSKGSARTTFLVGMLLTLPGASYLVGTPTAAALRVWEISDNDRIRARESTAPRTTTTQSRGRAFLATSLISAARERPRGQIVSIG